jgi:hypothetical protein
LGSIELCSAGIVLIAALHVVRASSIVPAKYQAHWPSSFRDRTFLSF